ncbi:iron chaperone [Daejeonella oryzae]|uniref:iron chaperone n=1 Tax=Daejeonella oryzae TaxID=1122943 RepID=UPI00040E0E5C|nr:DUF1801 domain-containing protein [Daejeonella oryzae]
MNAIDQYISKFPEETQVLLEKIRVAIQTAAPAAEETIKYQMPTYVLMGNLVHFAAYKKHIGFYPSPSAIVKFKTEISGFRNSKGAVQFPLDKEIPLELISKIVNFRVQENLEKHGSKKILKT